MNAYLRDRIAELKQVMGPMFYRHAIPGGLITLWPTNDGWMPIAIPDRAYPKGELREEPTDGSNSRFRYRFHYPDVPDDQADCWQRLIMDASHG